MLAFPAPGMSMFSTKGGLYERAKKQLKVQDGAKLFSYKYFSEHKQQAQVRQALVDNRPQAVNSHQRRSHEYAPICTSVAPVSKRPSPSRHRPCSPCRTSQFTPLNMHHCRTSRHTPPTCATAAPGILR
jgi:hypothetical protein